MAKSLAILATLAEFSAMSTKWLAVNSGIEVCVIKLFWICKAQDTQRLFSVKYLLGEANIA